MTEGEKKGFGGLDDQVSDVDRALKDAERAAKKTGNPDSGSQVDEERRASAAPRTSGGGGSAPSRAPAANTGSGGNGKTIGWIIAASVVFVIWAANQDTGPGTGSGSSSTTGYTSPPVASRAQPTPATPQLVRPPVGENNIHSMGELRYCVASDIRMEALRPFVSSNREVDAFNEIVSDYNRRCGNFRYRQGALSRARREVEPYRSVIVANAWQGLFLSAPSNADRRSAMSRSSQLTRNIQQALARLGYRPGTADGIYGPNTKAAIEAFERDMGLRATGQPSEPLLDLLEVMVATEPD